tara:strand:+ start:1449 stop:2048 length:600 start_codon:yes stop_codon:yes gene_type:complete
MNLNNIFPTPVAWFDNDSGINELQKKYLLSLKRKNNIGNEISLGRNVLENKELKVLKNWIINNINIYFEEIYKPKSKVKLYITQSWCNYTKENQYHHRHRHPNSFISGVYYIDVNEQKDKITFFNDIYKQLNIEASEYNLYNSTSWFFNLKNNSLVLFPSNLEHMVESVTSKTERVSLSFNTFLKGYLGQDEEATGLHL